MNPSFQQAAINAQSALWKHMFPRQPDAVQA